MLKINGKLVVLLPIKRKGLIAWFDLLVSKNFALTSVFFRSIVCLFLFCFVALRPKSSAMVMAGRSVHLTTLFPGQA